MFRLRIHTVETPSCVRHQLPRIEDTRATVHLFRLVSHRPPDPLPAAVQPGSSSSTLLLVLAVPSRVSTEDFLLFCGSYADRLSLLRFIRNDGIEDRYSVLLNFEDLKSANGFYRNFNGQRFSSSEAGVCRLLFIVDVEYTEFTEIAERAPDGLTELPSCPVCLERLDQDTSGIVTTPCDHSFQCSCTLKWTDSSCPVCHFCQQQPEKPTCSVCKTSENLWICLICGFVGCGRYKERHAIRHWEETQHCYSLDLETQRVWDYVGDRFVHRLNQSKNDGVKLNSSCRSPYEDHEARLCGEDYGMAGALFTSQVDAIVEEYSNLLTDQLDKQRQWTLCRHSTGIPMTLPPGAFVLYTSYDFAESPHEYYESILYDAKEKKKAVIAEAVEKAVSSKLQEMHLKLEKFMEEQRKVAEVNENLVRNQDVLQREFEEIKARERSVLKMQDEQIRDLEEQIRDITVYIEAQKTLNDMTDSSDIKGGTVLPISMQPSASNKAKKSSRANRKRS